MTEPTEVGIEGVRLFELTSIPDARVWFAEDYRRAWLPEAREMVQGNVSFSRVGVLRGLHFHRDQADWWTLLTGAAFVGLYDLRAGSPTQGVGVGLRIDTEEGLKGLSIPRGVAHGFYAERDMLLHYLVDAYHTGADEFGLAWDDPDLRLGWPDAEPITSERDRSNPRLSEVLADAPPFGA
ncbi:MAG: dTDP-4-dehydrorhamnose 3,5-epimerase family protein [Candidatus Limnocylindria bacterium]